jgi:hypothetical protein
MHADFFTKALQGSLFRQHRDFIMNVDPSNYNEDHRSVLRYDEQIGEPQAEVKTDGQTRKDDIEDPTLYRTTLLKHAEVKQDDPCRDHSFSLS